MHFMRHLSSRLKRVNMLTFSTQSGRSWTNDRTIWKTWWVSKLTPICDNLSKVLVECEHLDEINLLLLRISRFLISWMSGLFTTPTSPKSCHIPCLSKLVILPIGMSTESLVTPIQVELVTVSRMKHEWDTTLDLLLSFSCWAHRSAVYLEWF